MHEQNFSELTEALRSKVPLCLEHPSRPRVMVCLNRACKWKCLICQICHQKYHGGPLHEVYHLDAFLRDELRTISCNVGIEDDDFLRALKQSKQHILSKQKELSEILPKIMSDMFKKIRFATNNQFGYLIRSFNLNTYKAEYDSIMENFTDTKIINAIHNINFLRSDEFNRDPNLVYQAEQQYIGLLNQLENFLINWKIKIQKIRSVAQLKLNNSPPKIKMSGIKKFQKQNIKQPIQGKTKEQVNIVDSESEQDNSSASRSRQKNQRQRKNQIIRSPERQRIKESVLSPKRQRKNQSVVSSKRQKINQSIGSPKRQRANENIFSPKRQKIPKLPANLKSIEPKQQSKEDKIQFKILKKDKKFNKQPRLSNQKVLQITITPQKKNIMPFIIQQHKRQKKLMGSYVFPKKQQPAPPEVNKVQTIRVEKHKPINHSLVARKSTNNAIISQEMEINQSNAQIEYISGVYEQIQSNDSPRSVSFLVKNGVVYETTKNTKRVVEGQKNEKQKNIVAQNKILIKQNQQIQREKQKIYTQKQRKTQPKTIEKPFDPRRRANQQQYQPQQPQTSFLQPSQPTDAKPVSQRPQPVQQRSQPVSQISQPVQQKPQYRQINGKKRPIQKPTYMKQQKLISWFIQVYKDEPIQTFILSHRAQKQFVYLWYYKGQFQWKDRSYLDLVDETLSIKQYQESLKCY